MRLNRFIAQSGLCSRRNADVLIQEGRVMLNGKIIKELATQVEETDTVLVDGRPLPKLTETTIMLNKPRGYLCSHHDPFHEKTVYELLPENLRHLDMAGRLDKDSEGMLILSSNGNLLLELTHPRYEHFKVYEVEVRGNVHPNEIEQLKNAPFELDGYQLKPMYAEVIGTKPGSTQLKITLGEGRKRQIRRVMDLLGHRVLYLRRIQVGKLGLGNLALGAFRHLDIHDINALISTDRKSTQRS